MTGNHTGLTITAKPIPLEAGTDGVVRVGGTRVTLDTVVTAFKQGATAEEITITRYAYERGGRVSECQEYSRSAERFPSVWPLKTLCSWQSAASMMSGKVRYATYRCVDAHPSQARQQPASSCCRWGSLPHLHSITASSSNTVRLSMPACTP
jgi:hypothetical protein